MRIKIGTLNLFGRKAGFKDRAKLINNCLDEERFDVIFLQEVLVKNDLHPTLGFLESIGYEYTFFPTLNTSSGTKYGNAIVHKGKCIHASSTKLPGAANIEPRNAILMYTEIKEKNIVFICTHLSDGEDAQNLRLEQLGKLRETISHLGSTLKAPIILGGDFNMSKHLIQEEVLSKIKHSFDSHSKEKHLQIYENLAQQNNLAVKRGILKKIDFLIGISSQKTTIGADCAGYFGFTHGAETLNLSDHIGVKAYFDIVTS